MCNPLFVTDNEHFVGHFAAGQIGTGGTGSQALTCLARMHASLTALGHPGLFVKVFDADVVSQSNIGRQLFSPSETGLNKAVCLVTRINRFFGLGWEAVPEYFGTKQTKNGGSEYSNITITCTDNIASRIGFGKLLRKRSVSYRSHITPLYWLDMGNGQTSGQAVLGAVSKIEQPKTRKYTAVGELKTVVEMFDYSALKESDSGPSCSLSEALRKQDLFINSTLAQLGCDILWKLFRQGMIEHHGLYLNLDTMKVNPINV